MGIELSHDRIPIVAFIYTSLFIVLGTSGMTYLTARQFNLTVVTLFLILSTFTGLGFGVIQGMVQGLPIMPHFIMTSWPSRGHMIVFEDRIRFPWRYSYLFLSDIYSRKGLLLIPFNADQGLAFRNVLRGKYDK